MKLVNCICTALFCHITIASALSLTPPKSKKQISQSEYSGNSDQDNINDDIFLSGGGEQKDEHVNCTDSPGYKCVPYYLCENGSIRKDDEAGLIILQIGFHPIHDYSCVGFLDVCCKDPSHVPSPPQPNSANQTKPNAVSTSSSPDANEEVKNTVENCSEKPGYGCVPYHLCDYESLGWHVIQIGEQQAKIPLNCPGFLNVCCKDPHSVPEPPQSNDENKMMDS